MTFKSVSILGVGMVLAMTLMLGACRKTSKTSTAGGGASSQSIMTIRGATR